MNNIFACTIKTAPMDNSKNLELEILITVRQNKNIPINDFHRIFEYSWILYDAKFNQLIAERLIVPVQVADLLVYQLTNTGKARISLLIEQREQEITIRLLHLKQISQMRFKGWKTAMVLLNSIIHFRTPAQKIAGSEPQIVNEASVQ